MSEPFWLAEATATCPKEALEAKRLTSALQALPNDAPMLEFVALYEQMLAARSKLYEAWIDLALEVDEPLQPTNAESERHA